LQVWQDDLGSLPASVTTDASIRDIDFEKYFLIRTVAWKTKTLIPCVRGEKLFEIV
jgi:hypothetical protein